MPLTQSSLHLGGLACFFPKVRWLLPLLAFSLPSCQEKDPWAGDSSVPLTISFNQHIRPLLSRECLSCHNEAKAEGGLRLDLPSGVASVVSDSSPRKSRLWEQIAANHPVALSSRKQGILWRWIKQGTPTEGHWASLPLNPHSFSAQASPLSPNEPVTEQEFAFLSRTLFGREPSSVEKTYNSAHQPPRGQLIDDMLKQASFAQSFQTRLLLFSGAQPVAPDGPFAPYLRWFETQLFEPDFSLANFFQQALAGDLVPDSGQQGAIATAWTRLPHRNGISSLRERIAQNLLGLDLSAPVSSQEIWPNALETLTAFIPEFPPATHGEIALPPFLPLHTPQQIKALKTSRMREKEAWKQLSQIPDNTTIAFAEWFAEEETAVSIPDLAVSFSFDQSPPQDLSPRPLANLTSPATVTTGAQGTALAPPASFSGFPLSSDRSFTLSFFLKVPQLPNKETPLFFAQTPLGAPVGFQFNLSTNNLTIGLLNGSAKNSLGVTASTLPTPNHWHHFAIGYNGSRKASGFRLWIDSKPIALTPAHDELYGIASAPDGALQFRYPSSPEATPALLDELQIYRGLLSELEIAHLRDGQALLNAIRDEFPREDLLFKYYLRSKSVPARENTQRALNASNEVSTLEATALLVPVAGPTPLPALRPALPFYPLPLDSEPDRLGFAHWLFDERNPITPRIMASRFYELVYGVGLLPPSGLSDPWQVPPNPALLDHLASELIAADWNLRKILRIILLNPPSATTEA